MKGLRLKFSEFKLELDLSRMKVGGTGVESCIDLDGSHRLLAVHC